MHRTDQFRQILVIYGNIYTHHCSSHWSLIFYSDTARHLTGLQCKYYTCVYGVVFSFIYVCFSPFWLNSTSMTNVISLYAHWLVTDTYVSCFISQLSFTWLPWLSVGNTSRILIFIPVLIDRYKYLHFLSWGTIPLRSPQPVGCWFSLKVVCLLDDLLSTHLKGPTCPLFLVSQMLPVLRHRILGLTLPSQLYNICIAQRLQLRRKG